MSFRAYQIVSILLSKNLKNFFPLGTSSMAVLPTVFAFCLTLSLAKFRLSKLTLLPRILLSSAMGVVSSFRAFGISSSVLFPSVTSAIFSSVWAGRFPVLL